MNVFQKGKMYFATSYRDNEITCLQQAQPPHILASFAMWRIQKEDKDLKKLLLDRIGYKPKSILVDSGAYSLRNIEYGISELIENYVEMREEDGYGFDIDNPLDLMQFTRWCLGEFEEDFYYKDKNEFSLFEQYLNFLWWNKGTYDYCFAFDKMGDNQESLLSYKIMNCLGLPVIPVYQATLMYEERVEANIHDFEILDYYASKSDYIGIGGTAISKVKGYTKTQRIEIVRRIIERHPNKKFHLLGTLDPVIVEACPELYTFDGQCWLQKVKKEYKISESVRHINNKMNWFNMRKKETESVFAEDKNGQLRFAI